MPIAALAGRGIEPSRLGRLLVHLNPSKRFHQVCQFHAEEPNPAISINEKACPTGLKPFPDHFHQFGQQEKVVLKKGVLGNRPIFRRNAQHDLQPSFGWRVRPHLLDLRIQGRLGDEALFDIDHQPVIRSNKPNVESLLKLVPLAANHDSISIPIRLRAGNHRVDHSFGKSANPFEQSGDLLVLEFKLTRVSDMLILAAAAIAEIPAGRGDPVRGSLQHFEQPRAGKALLHLGDFDLHLFLWQHKRHKHDKIIHPRHAFATKSNIVDSDDRPLAKRQFRCRFERAHHPMVLRRTEMHMQARSVCGLRLQALRQSSAPRQGIGHTPRGRTGDGVGLPFQGPFRANTFGGHCSEGVALGYDGSGLGPGNDHGLLT